MTDFRNMIFFIAHTNLKINLFFLLEHVFLLLNFLCLRLNNKNIKMLLDFKIILLEKKCQGIDKANVIAFITIDS